MRRQLLPATANRWCWHEEVSRKRIDQCLTIHSGRADPEIGRVLVSQQMVSQLVRQVEATPAGIDAAVNYRNPKISQPDIASVRHSRAEINRERQQPHSLDNRLEIHEWARLLPNQTSSFRCARLRLFQCADPYRRASRWQRQHTDIHQQFNITARQLQRVVQSLNVTIGRNVRTMAGDRGWRLGEEPLRGPTQSIGKSRQLQRVQLTLAAFDPRDRRTMQLEPIGQFLLGEAGALPRDDDPPTDLGPTPQPLTSHDLSISESAKTAHHIRSQ